MRNNRQPTPNEGNGDSPTLQKILETMNDLQKTIRNSESNRKSWGLTEKDKERRLRSNKSN